MNVILASLALLSVQPRRAYSKERDRSVEPDDHYPLTCTPEKWRLDAWELEYLPFFAFAWKRSEELESYDVL